MRQLLNIKPRRFKVHVKNLNRKTMKTLFEYRRWQLHKLAQCVGDLTNPNVVRISQKIDEYIVYLQKMKMNK